MSQVRPLTKCREDGTPYTRRAEVEREIAMTLTLSLEEIVARARAGTAQPLRDETIVYWLRESWHRTKRWHEALVEILSERCARHLLPKVRSYRDAVNDPADIVSSVLVDILDRIRKNNADYLEVAFLSYIERRFVDHVRGILNEQKHFGEIAPLGSGDCDDEDDGTVPEPADRGRLSVEDQVMLRQALQALRAAKGDQHYHAFILHHLNGWPIGENKEPHTLSERFNVTGRTIRNWNRESERFLRAWLEGEKT
jgi:hypothetical protein